MKTEKIVIKADLTVDEKSGMCENISRIVGEIENLEEEKKLFTQNVNATIKEKEAQISEVAEKVRRGWIEKQMECEVVSDFVRMTKRYYRIDTGELVETIRIKPEDAQMEIDFQGNAFDGVVPDQYSGWWPVRVPWDSRLPISRPCACDLDCLELWRLLKLQDEELFNSHVADALNFAFMEGEN